MKSLLVSITCKAVFSGDFIFPVRGTRFADGDRTKCSSQDGNFQPGLTMLKSSGQQAV